MALLPRLRRRRAALFAHRSHRRMVLTQLALILTVLAIAARPAMALMVPPEAPRRVLHVPGHTVRTTEVWHRGSLVHLDGPLVIAAGGELRIEPGTEVRVAASAVIVIERSARIHAVGTLHEPIVLRCQGTPARGCWTGVLIAGNAPIATGTLTSPAARGTGAAGCREQIGDGIASAFGGCEATDSSGVMRFVRVEYASRGVELNGVGSRTVVQDVQVHGSASNGVLLNGGTARLRHLIVTASTDAGLRWRNGWQGEAQFIALQRIAADSVPMMAAEGSATTLVGPTVRNVTMAGTGAGAAMHVTGSVRGRVENVLVVGLGSVLDADGLEACTALTSEQFDVRHLAAVATTTLADADADTDCGSASNSESDFLVRPAAEFTQFGAQALSSLLKQPLSLLLPDLRPNILSALPTGSAAPSTGFFETPASFLGALAQTDRESVTIPWYSGWSIDGDAPVLPFGLVTGTVRTVEGSAIAGALVLVSNADLPASSATSGAFTVALARPGSATLTADALPPGCTATPVPITVVANTATIADVTVSCGPVVISLAVIRLTYMCGNTFRVRNGNLAAVNVTWDLYGTAESGALTLPARAFNASYSETFFTTQGTGTVKLLYRGNQVDVKANGGFACAP